MIYLDCGFKVKVFYYAGNAGNMGSGKPGPLRRMITLYYPFH